MSELNEVFLDELQDIYHAEHQLLKALPRMAKAAQAPELKQAFESHRAQTEGQIRRLENVFKLLGKPAKGKKCKGMLGIIDENKEMLTELRRSPALDAVLISGAQKVEHYEIATYGTLKTWAQLLENEQAGKLLEESLNEEEETDTKLTKLAEQHANPKAASE